MIGWGLPTSSPVIAMPFVDTDRSPSVPSRRAVLFALSLPLSVAGRLRERLPRRAHAGAGGRLARWRTWSGRSSTRPRTCKDRSSASSRSTARRYGSAARCRATGPGSPPNARRHPCRAFVRSSTRCSSTTDRVGNVRTRDNRQRFLIESCDVRGQICHLDDTWREATARVDYPPLVRGLLGKPSSPRCCLRERSSSRGA